MNAFEQTSAGNRAVACPYCGSSRTELFSLFGSQLLTVQYYCQTCHTPFEYIRDTDTHDARETARSLSRDEHNDVSTNERKENA